MSDRKARVEQSWFQALPMGWGTRRIKDLVRLINGYPFPSELFEAEGGVPLVRIRDIGRNTTETSFLGTPVTSALITSQDVLIGMDGDFTVGRWLGSRPALLNQRVCALRSRDTALLRYIEYALPYPLGIVNQLAYSTTVKHLSSGEVLHTRVPLPDDPRVLMNVVAFLDHETARIDELVREQERLIELLVEDLDAQIFSLFTAGASRSVHRSASGNPWFPEIPSHWTMSRLGWVVASIQTGPFGSQLHAEDYVTSGTPLINPASIGPRGLIEEDARRVDEETLNRLKDYRLRSGDIVLGRRGQMGRCALVTDGQDGWLLGTGSMRIRPNSSVNEEFLAFYLGSRIARSYLELESVGTTMSNLNSEIVGGLPLPLPPISEQDAIVTSIQEATRLVDESIDAAKSMIEYLLERRSALISSAVTGQLDLRDWRPPAAAPVAVAEVA